MLMQLLGFWTTVLFFFFCNNFYGAAVCLHPEAEIYSFGPKRRDNPPHRRCGLAMSIGPYLNRLLPEDENRIKSPKCRWMMSKTQ
jgi:hypothetical protein